MSELNTDLKALKRLANSGEMDSDDAMMLDEAHDEIAELREEVSGFKQAILDYDAGKLKHKELIEMAAPLNGNQKLERK